MRGHQDSRFGAIRTCLDSDRLGYRDTSRTAAVELFGEIFNLTNRANFDILSGERRSSAFLVLNSLR